VAPSRDWLTYEGNGGLAHGSRGRAHERAATILVAINAVLLRRTSLGTGN
jgi:hypothetical protein